jgi:iron complex outermembrane recepter protein
VSHTAQPTPRLSTLATAISGALGTTVVAAPAVAQDVGLEEIVVTGSRIVRRDFTAPSPIVTVDAERLEQSSTLSIESVLNQMPQFTPAGTQFVSGGQGSPTTALGIASLNLRGIGTNRTLVLVDGRRSQPANAALVVDINTIPSAAIARVETITGGASAVYGSDALAGVVNFVLKDDFEGIEVDLQNTVTGEGDGRETRFTTLFGMNSADGRGNIMLGLEYYDRDVVWQRDRKFYRNGWYDPGTSAPGFVLAPGFSFAGPNNRPSQDTVNALFEQYHGDQVAPPNVVWDTPGAVHEIYFNPDGSPFVLSGARGYNGPLGKRELGDGDWGMRIQPNGSLGQVFEGLMASTPQERHAIFGRARYEVTDNLTAFAQVTYSNNTVTSTGGIPPAITVWQASAPNDGRPLPSALQELIDSRPDPTEDWRLFRGIDFFGQPSTTDNNDNFYHLTAGVEGRFPNNDWTWEFYVTTGETDTRNDYRYLPSLQRYQALVRLPEFGAGDTGFGPGRHVFGREYVLECSTGLAIFGGSANMDPNCLDSIDMRARASSTLTQDIVEFNLQGKIADMRSGELRFAVGASYRDNTFRFEPLNDNRAISDHPIGLFVSDNTYGEVDVKEVYGELLLPVTERLNLELGYRHSQYNTAAGDINTWKALFDYAATGSVRLRGGFQRATRAPNTAELFQGPIMLTVGFGPSDPCSYTTAAPWGNADGIFNPNVPENPRRLEIQQLCIDLIGNPNTAFGGTPGTAAANNFARPGNPFFPLENVFEAGNTDLIAESADTWTFGFVLAGVGGLNNLTASVDMYSIDMSEAIGRLDPVFVYEQCFNADGVSNPTLSINDPGGYCAMIGRHPFTGERDTVRTPFVNQGALKTSGVDLAVNWATDLRGGSFYINALASWLNEYRIQYAATQPFLEAKGTLAEGGQYEYRLNTTFGYGFGGGRSNVGLRWTHLPSVEDAAAIRPTALRGTDSYNLFSLFAGYSFNERLSLRGGIDNLLDEQPRVIGANPGVNNAAASTNAQYYDILGRRAYVALKMSF